MISIHLSDEELTLAAAGERNPRSAFHLQICSECRQSVEMYRERLASLRHDVCYSASQSAIDWGTQSRNIRQRIAMAQIGKATHSSMLFALAGSALALALIVLVFFGFRNPEQPVVRQQIRQTISDAALLNDVEAQLNEDVPEALQPAYLLVGEMGGIDGDGHRKTSQARTRTAQ